MTARVIAEAEPGAPADNAGRFFAGLASAPGPAAREWTPFALPFRLAAQRRVVPAFDVAGRDGGCSFDNLMLNGGGQAEPYSPPAPAFASLRVTDRTPTPMPGLYFSKDRDGVVLNAQFKLRSESFGGEVQVRATLTDPEGVVTQLPPKTLTVAKGHVVEHDYKLTLPSTGIWLINASATMQGSNSAAVASTVVATMRAHQGRADPAFGTQQKLSPLTAPMGFGSVRDMHLLAWSAVMPEPGRWVGPSDAETAQIRRFVDAGGSYLATLVSENPSRAGYAAEQWGKPDFGGVPAWAAADRDSSPGIQGKPMRALKPEAFGAYAAAAAKALPFIAFEVMNEPIFYLGAGEYAGLLEGAYRAIKSVAPQAPVVAFGSPPNWFRLPGGRDAVRNGAKPWDWFEDVMTTGGSSRSFDVVGIHPYDRKQGAESPEQGYIPGGQGKWADGLRQLAARARQRDDPPPVWVTEKGISSPSWRVERQFVSANTSHRVSSALTQARWIVRSQLDMRSHGVDRFFLWNQAWSTGAAERFFPFEDVRYTLFDADGLPRPALIAQRVLIENLSFATLVGAGEPVPGVRYLLYKGGNGVVAVLWSYGPDERAELAGRGARAPSCPQLAGAAVQIGMYGQEKPYRCEGRLQLGPSPIYVVGTDAESGAWLKSLAALR